MLPLLVPAPPPGPGAARPGQPVPLPIGLLTASLGLTRAEGAGPHRLEQLTTTLLNRETMSGSRKQHS